MVVCLPRLGRRGPDGVSSVGESARDSHEPANALEFGEADRHNGTQSPGFCGGGSLVFGSPAGWSRSWKPCIHASMWRPERVQEQTLFPDAPMNESLPLDLHPGHWLAYSLFIMIYAHTCGDISSEPKHLERPRSCVSLRVDWLSLFGMDGSPAVLGSSSPRLGLSECVPPPCTSFPGDKR